MILIVIQLLSVFEQYFSAEYLEMISGVFLIFFLLFLYTPHKLCNLYQIASKRK